MCVCTRDGKGKTVGKRSERIGLMQDSHTFCALTLPPSGIKYLHVLRASGAVHHYADLDD